ncbi:hypothetical protein [Brevundimonas denitrificans]|uniref:hypothetical protein n=1 Tax=Brevundimonas denitrificans TaxID=1443434 RepID=UPI00223BD185|nr:hypothetical protein [Brevundimonas denitrificans]
MSDFSRSGARRPRWSRLAVRSGVFLIVAGVEVALFLTLSRMGLIEPPLARRPSL